MQTVSMRSRTVARAALALQIATLGLTFGWRSWLQYRRTGDSGFRLGPATPPTARVASGLMIAGAAAGIVGTAANTRTETCVRATRIFGLAAIVAGLVGTYRAQLDMGKSWRIGVDEDEHTELVAEGLFRHVRNPIFSFLTLIGAGTFAAVPNATTAVGTALLAAGVDVQVRMVEEPYLRATHGEAYARYVSETGRYVPKGFPFV